MRDITIGMDIGGTALKAGLVTPDGTILASASAPTGAGRDPEAIIADMAALCFKVAEEGDVPMDEVQAVGFGLPGLSDNKTGYVIHLTNLKWRRLPFREIFHKHLNKPIYLENDATVAAMAEATCGISKNSRSSVFLTLGTGVGGGIVLEGKPYTGAHGVASELGHMMVECGPTARPCNCGNQGCLERYCASLALVEQANLRLPNHPESSLTNLGDAKLSPRTIFAAAREGDPLGKELFDEFVHYLSLGIVSFINILDPEMFVLGGGISNEGAPLLEAVRAKVKEHIFYKDLPYGSIELATLGNDAGVIGAAMVGRALVRS